jgi:hypothetical protein
MEMVADRWEPASLFAVSGVPGASPVVRGRARGAGHRIWTRRTKLGYGERDWNLFWSSAPQFALENALEDATGDALTLLEHLQT